MTTRWGRLGHRVLDLAVRRTAGTTPAQDPAQPCSGCGDGSAGRNRRNFLALTGRAGIVVAGGVAGLGLTATPAGAHPIRTVGWTDNHTICRTCTYRTGNIVGLWQNLLWVANVSGTSSNCNSWVDGIFGPATETATKNWQRVPSRNLTADGVVGPLTWRRMRSELYSGSDNQTHIKYVYPAPNLAGSRGVMWLQMRRSDATWYWQRCGDSVYRNTGH